MELGLCIEMALTELPFTDRLQKAADLGFKKVEMWFVDGSYKGDPATLAKLAAKAKVTITNTVIGSPDGGVGGGLTDAKHRADWLARARRTLEFNQAAGIPATIVCTGNVVAGRSDKQQYQAVLGGLKATAELAEAAGITLLLEPLNTRWDHRGYWLTSSDRGAELCRATGSPRMKLLFDCYHMQIMEGDLLKHIEANLDVIGHFHSAGVPGRHELDAGEVDYAFLVKHIGKLGYKGVFGLEYAPTGNAVASLRRMRKYLGAK